MPQIIIENLYRKSLSFNHNQRVLSVIQDNFVDYMHACGGKGRCTSCKMKVVDGAGSLTPPSPFERQCLEKRLLKTDERLACQCAAHGDLIIRIPDENKLPHMNYSD